MANTDAAAQAPALVKDLFFQEIYLGTAPVFPDPSVPEVEDMIYMHEYKTSRGTRITAPFSNLMDFPIQRDGSGHTIRVHGNSGTGSSTFNVRKNGVSLFAGVGRPVLETGETYVELDELAIAVVKGDLIQLDLEAVTGSGLLSDVHFAFEVTPDE